MQQQCSGSRFMISSSMTTTIAFALLLSSSSAYILQPSKSLWSTIGLQQSIIMRNNINYHPSTNSLKTHENCIRTKDNYSRRRRHVLMMKTKTDSASSSTAAAADNDSEAVQSKKPLFFAEENSSSSTTTTTTKPSKDIPGPFEMGGSPAVIFQDDVSSADVYKQAISRTLLWVIASGIFGVGLWFAYGADTSQEFYAGYLIEQSLSVDNLFVFLLLFDFFKVPLNCQDRILNWGIYGAIVMRATMIGVGAAAIQNFHAVLLVFAGILIYSSANVLLGGEDDEDEDMSDNAIVKFSKKLVDYTDEFDGDRFFTVVDGMKKATPLFICMICIELADVVFAVDSIPAVFGVTENPLIVFTSNMFAIMGLRSLYTILSQAAQDLKYLEPAVAVVLGFIGSKMVGEFFGYEISTSLSLSVVVLLLGGGIGLSIYDKRSNQEQEQQESVVATSTENNSNI